MYLLFFVFLFAVGDAVSFTVDWKVDYVLEYYWNNTGVATYPGSGWIKGDGFTSIVLNENQVLLSWFDSQYGYFNASTHPVSRHFFPDGFSHSSFAHIPVKDGSPTAPFKNTPGTWLKQFNVADDPSNWYWPIGYTLMGGKLYMSCNQLYVKDNGEWYNSTHIMIVENPLDDIMKWDISTNYELPPGSKGRRDWGGMGEDEEYIYLHGYGFISRFLKSEWQKGVFHNQECWSNVSGKAAWSQNCDDDHLALLFTVPWGGSYGNPHWNSYLQSWVIPLLVFCDVHLITAPAITGPWTISTKLLQVPDPYDHSFCYQPNLHSAFVSSTKPNELVFSVNTDVNTDDAWVMIPLAIRMTLKLT